MTVLPHTLHTALSAKSSPRKAYARSATARDARRSSASGEAAPPTIEERTLRVAIALFPQAEELDWAGPWEVFGYWASRWPDEVQAFTVAETLDPIRCARGLRVLPDRTWQMAPLIDVLIYPGGRGTQAEIANDGTIRRLRALEDGGALMASVCTGSLVFAAAGLLDGRAATTHHTALEDLRSLGNDIDVLPGERFVDAGGVITAGGVSAGIDMSIYLVARLHSPGRADAIRRAIEYGGVPSR
jgi:transcriptional regulator GlxA family with amidase domain